MPALPHADDAARTAGAVLCKPLTFLRSAEPFDARFTPIQMIGLLMSRGKRDVDPPTAGKERKKQQGGEMMKCVKLLLACSVLGFALPGQANPIFYEVTNLGGNTWRYDYTLGNETADPIDSFTVFFALNVFENLAVLSSPASWDSFVAQPDPFLPDDGFFDTFDLTFFGVNPGETLSGFSVGFDFLGVGTPGSQPFDVNPFGTISSGVTRLGSGGDPTPVPAPSTLILLVLGLGCLLVRRLRRSAAGAKATASPASTIPRLPGSLPQ